MLGGHSSGCLPGIVLGVGEEAVLQVVDPERTASRNPTEQRWPVTLTPRLCASSIAARIASRLIVV